MARTKIDLPARMDFVTLIPIRITDLNYGGHVGNDTILALIHEARMQFLAQKKTQELVQGGIGLIMSDVAIEFKAELFYGDLVRAIVGLGEFSAVGFDLFYKLEKQINGKDIPAALAKTGMVFYNYTLKKIAAVPAELKTLLQN